MKKNLAIAMIILILFNIYVLQVGAKLQTQSETTQANCSSIIDDNNNEYLPNEIIVKLKKTSQQKTSTSFTGIESLNKLEEKFSIKDSKEFLPNVYKLISSTSLDIPQAIHEFGKNPHVEFAEPNYIYRVSLVPNDPYYSEQWSHQVISSEEAWDMEIGESYVLVAIVDTGIDWNHSDLKANYASLGYDWVNNDTNPMDDHGHGTHCAGIVTATFNNSMGITGVANVSVMAEKGICSAGWGTEEWLAQAIIHATDQGAEIISMSWGGGNSSLIYDAIEYAYDEGVLLVAAAGNYGDNEKHFPAGYDEVVAVIATDMCDEKAYWSNYGNWTEISAPGDYIYSTMPNNTYGHMSGTSMACPHVAGTAALIWSRFPALSRNEVRYQLHWTTDDLGVLGPDDYFGYGRINLRWAVETFKPNKNVRLWGWQIGRVVKTQIQQTINVSVLNSGKYSLWLIYVDLKVDGDTIDTKLIEILGSLDYTILNFSWTPTSEKWYDVSVSIRPLSGEATTEDNVLSENVLSRYSSIVHVPTDFQTIKEAVKITPSGYTIQVAAGTYYESLVMYRSNVTLTGEDPYTTILEAGSDIAVLSFKNYTTIANLTIRSDLCAIFLSDSSLNTIQHNILITNGTGIRAQGDSIYNKIKHNILVDNIYAIFIFVRSSYTSIIENTISNNTLGLWLWHNDENVITGNVISQNHKGIDLWRTNNNTVTCNEIRDNDYGIVLETGTLTNNSFYHNNIINNTYQVFIGQTQPPEDLNGTVWDNGEEGNYWSDYNGTDANDDGIGDTPYQGNVTDNYPLMEPRLPECDRAINNVSYALAYDATAIYPSWTVNVTVTAKNKALTSDSFFVIAYYNSSIADAKIVINLAAETEMAITIVWDTTDVSPGTIGLNYTISGRADIAADPNIEDNEFSDGILRVRYPGDTDDDGDVDIYDIVTVTNLYGSSYGDGEYDWQADFNGDGEIDILDVTIATSNYGHQG